MKKWFLALFFGLLTLLVIDVFVAREQSGKIQAREGSADFLAAITSKIKPGMSRANAEEILSGFRDMEEAKQNSKTIVSYGYWFGFIPPLSRSGFKYVGEIYVTYSGEGKAIDTSYLYN